MVVERRGRLRVVNVQFAEAAQALAPPTGSLSAAGEAID